MSKTPKFEKTFQDNLAKLKELHSELGIQLGTYLKNFVSSVDESVHSIKWEQYTPYFNDGDSCEFTIGEIRVKFNDGDNDAGEMGDGYLSSYDIGTWDSETRSRIYTKEDKVRYEILDRIGKTFTTIPNDLFLVSYDDHKSIIIYTDGTVDIEDYDHD
jgi:hypothetical protein